MESRDHMIMTVEEKKIYVLNASSRQDTGITDSLTKLLSWSGESSVPTFHCVTLHDGPCGISTARDSAEAAVAVLRYIDDHHAEPDCAGFIIACFSDPGVAEAKDITDKPVLGIGGAGLASATAFGRSIGTIGVSKDGQQKVRQLARNYGMGGLLIGHRSLGLDYSDLQNTDRVVDHLVRACESLAQENDAGAILLAGAGMQHFVAALQARVTIPIIEPVLAAAGMMLGMTHLKTP